MPDDVRLVQLPVGEPVWVRVAAIGPADVGDRSLPFDASTLLNTVSSVAQNVRHAATSAKPDSVSVEFGIEIAAKAGKLVSVLADIGGSATLKVTLNWQSGAASTGAPPSGK